MTVDGDVAAASRPLDLNGLAKGYVVDRALVASPTLYLAVLTGIFYDAPEFGRLRDAARRVHVEVAAFATLATLAHGVPGVLDTWLVVSGSTPRPAYTTGYLLAGVGVGTGATLLLVVSVLGFVDARRFERPWGPRVVHAFAYGGIRLRDDARRRGRHRRRRPDSPGAGDDEHPPVTLPAPRQQTERRQDEAEGEDAEADVLFELLG
ncbi:MAG: hypothetical protein ABEJ78_11195 [Haloferacaceae archaeon]